MTDTTTTPAKEALGVGAIVSESFSILFKNFITVVILGFVPAVLGLIVSGIFIGWGLTLGTEDAFTSGNVSGVGIAISTILQMGLYGVTIALLVLFAYDAKMGRKVAISRYIGPAIAVVIPVTILSIVISILVGFGALGLGILGLWVYAVFSVTIPAVVIEKAGFGGMSRSSGLTKEYRWPVAGALILMLLCTVALSFAAVFVVGIIVAAVGNSAFGILISVILMAAINGFTYGLTGISTSLIYARLREIKEGVSVDSLAAVFE